MGELEPEKHKDRKLHVDILPGNWTRLRTWVDRYNTDEDRVTPRIKVRHVVNQALDQYLSARGIE